MIQLRIWVVKVPIMLRKMSMLVMYNITLGGLKVAKVVEVEAQAEEVTQIWQT